MEHICFTMLVADEHRDAYQRMHPNVWPDLLNELHRAGWANYSLFLRDDGLLVGYLETPDWRAAQRLMSATDVASRWSIEMDKLVVPGSTMQYPELTRHVDDRAGEYRHCLVLDAPTRVETAELMTAGARNVSVFERADGLTVIYCETTAPGAPRMPDHAVSLREVFNLAEQRRASAR